MDPYLQELVGVAGKEAAQMSIGFVLKAALASIKGKLSRADEKKAERFAARLVAATGRDIQKYDPKRQQLEQRVGPRRAERPSSRPVTKGAKKPVAKKRSAKRV